MGVSDESSIEAVELSDKFILIVDDEPFNVLAIEGLL